jgi:RNA polymerase sigma-70 factor, ECF subfamily
VSQPDKPAAFHELWCRHAADVHRFALYLSGDAATADDLTSAAFLLVWEAWDRVRWPTVKSYLFATVRNLRLRQLQRGRRDTVLPVSLASPGSLAQQTEQKQELGRVMEALKELPEVDRAALLLRVHEDLPYAQIAAILGIPEVTAKVKVHRARLRLAQSIERKVSA